MIPIRDENVDVDNLLADDSGFELQDDPGKWPENITDRIRLYLVKNIPPQVRDINFPINAQGRKFNPLHYDRVLPNGERVNRSWLLYSECKNKVYCCSCYLFSNELGKCSLASKCNSDWRHLGEILASHEGSVVHGRAQFKLLDLQKRLDCEATLDATEQRLINAEIQHWRSVLKRIIICIQYLAKHNEALRGSSSTIYTNNNGKFLGLVEKISQFDIVMLDHLTRIKNKQTNDHYLGWSIQNQIINLMAQKVKPEIINRIKGSKYFSVQLDCTSNISRKEQLTLIIRIVEVSPISKATINEYFIDFIHVTTTTGLNLSNVLKEHLNTMGLSLNNCRSQSYDNGANMVGKAQGVQSRILFENPRAFFVPCAAHSLNLLLGEMAKSVPMAMTFFRIVQRFYTIFAGSNERWAIITSHLPGLTLKPLSATRWECRVQSMKPIRHQINKIRDALEEVSEETKDPMIKSEAVSLAEHEINFEFVLSTVIWYDLLIAVDKVSKSLQNKSTDVSVATSLLKGLQDYLQSYRENNFESSFEII